MTFSRIQITLLSSILLLIVVSGSASYFFVRQRANADQLVRRASYLPAAMSKRIETQGNLPVVNDTDWSIWEVKLQAAAQKNLVLSWEDRTFSPSNKELESFVSYSIDGGQVVNDINTQAIDRFVAKIARTIDVKEKPRKVTADGELVVEGRAGRRLDRDHANNALLQTLLADGVAKSISLQVEEINPDEKVVAKPFTPGLYEGKYIEINLSTQAMYVFEGNNVVKQYTVSTGKWNMPTPEGTFAINNKVEVAYSKRYNLYMPNWQSFVGSSYGIHGLPYRGKWIEGESHLGTPVSHGCVRLSWENARELYEWADIGTVVYIHS